MPKRQFIKKSGFKRKRPSFKGRYAAYRRGLAIPRTTTWSTNRDTRPFVFNAVSCWENSGAAVIAGVVQGATSANYVFAPRLGDFSSSADFIATYDAYRVLSCELSLHPTYDPGNTNNGSALITNEWVKTAIDINDLTVFTALLYEQSSSCRIHACNVNITRKWQPAFINTNAQGVNLIQDEKDAWISVSAGGSTVPQLGCKVFIPPYAAAASAQAVSWIVKVRMVVIGRSQG